MDTNQKPQLLLKQEVYRIVGAAIEGLNELGHGFNEKPCENAIVVEFQLQKIPYLQQPTYQMNVSIRG